MTATAPAKPRLARDPDGTLALPSSDLLVLGWLRRLRLPFAPGRYRLALFEDDQREAFLFRLCRGPHPSGDFYVPADVACVAEACPFTEVRTIEDICARLAPNPPNDPCAKAEAQLMALELDVCRGHVSDTDAVHPSCGSAATIGEARARTEAQLCDPGRTPSSCRGAACPPSR